MGKQKVLTMKVLVLLWCMLLRTQSQGTDPLPPSLCSSCKSVSGPGPLAGEYYLLDTEEPLCGDGCVYTREGHSPQERYCFVKELSVYNVSYCEEIMSTTAAPFMKVIKTVIEEDGEVYEQVDTYNNETGEVSIEVPPHGDREPLTILLDPIADTLVATTPSKC